MRRVAMCRFCPSRDTKMRTPRRRGDHWLRQGVEDRALRMDKDLALHVAALQLGFVTEADFDRVVDPSKMVKPYVAAGAAKTDPTHGGILEFGTELVNAADHSIIAMLGASPGASTAVWIT